MAPARNELRPQHLSLFVLATLVAVHANAQVTLDAAIIDQPLTSICGPSDLTVVPGSSDATLFQADVRSYFGAKETAVAPLGQIQNGTFARTNSVVFPEQEYQYLRAIPSAPGQLFAATRRHTQSNSYYEMHVLQAAGLSSTFSSQVSLFASSISSLAVTDFSNSNTFRFSYGVYGGVASYHSGTASAAWNYAASAETRVLTEVQVDADPQQELIVASTTHLEIIDGATGLVQNSLAEPTAYPGKLGNLDHDPEPELILRGRSGGLITYDLPGLTERWRFDQQFVVDFDLYDRNQDGRVEILVIDNFAGAQWLQPDGTAEVRRTLDMDFPGQVQILELTGAPPAEALIRDGCKRRSAYALDLATPLATKYSDVGPFSNLQVADLDRDGDLELLTLSSNGEGVNPPKFRLRVVDAASGLELMRGGQNGLPDAEGNLYDLSTVQFDEDPQLEFMVAKQDFTDGSDPVLIFDGASLTLQNTVTLSTGDAPRKLQAIRYADVDGDNEIEWLMLTTEGAGQSRLRVLRASDLTLEWESPTLSGTTFTRLSVAQIDTDPALEAILIRENGVLVWDMFNHLTQVSLVGSYLDAAVTTEQGAQVLKLLQSDRIDTVAPDNGMILSQLNLTGTSSALWISPTQPTLGVLASTNRLRAIDLRTGTTLAESRVLGSQLADTGALLGTTSGEWPVLYAGNRFGVWQASLQEAVMFKDSFE